MKKSLINPNQCRSFGIPTCDDPTDPHRTLGFIKDDIQIPFDMNGSTAFFTSRTPTPEEMDICPKYILSDIEHWDPHTVSFSQYMSNCSTLQTNIGEFDIALSQVSSCFDLRQVTSILTNRVTINRVTSTTPRKKSIIADKPKLEDFGKNTLTKNRHHHISPDTLSRKWGCGLKTAMNTLKGTTQLGIRSAIGPLTRRYRTDLLQLHYKRLNSRFYTDTMFSKVKSIKGNACAQIYTDGEGFVTAYPMESKSMAGKSLHKLFDDIGIPNKLVYDGAPEQVGKNTAFQKLISKHRIIGHQNEPFTQKYNRAEDSIRELKRRWRQRIIRR